MTRKTKIDEMYERVVFSAYCDNTIYGMAMEEDSFYWYKTVQHNPTEKDVKEFINEFEERKAAARGIGGVNSES